MIYKYNYRQSYGIASGYSTNKKWIGIQYWSNKTQGIYYKDQEVYYNATKTVIIL